MGAQLGGVGAARALAAEELGLQQEVSAHYRRRQRVRVAQVESLARLDWDCCSY